MSMQESQDRDTVKRFQGVRYLFQKHSFVSFLGVSLFFKFLALVLGLFINRILNTSVDASRLADYNVAIAYTPIVLSIINFGIPNLIQKLYTNEKSERVLSLAWKSLQILRLGSFFIGILLIAFTYRLTQVNDFVLILSVYIVQFVLIADLSFRSLFDAIGRSWVFSFTDFLSKFILIGIFFLPFLEKTIETFILASLCSYVITYILDYFIAKDSIYHFQGYDFSFITKNRALILRLGITSLSLGILLNSDRIILNNFNFSDFEINGYSNAYRLVELSMIIPGLTMPTFASKVKSKISQLNLPLSYAKKWIIYTSCMGLVFGAALFISSPIFFYLIDPLDKYTNFSLMVMPYLAVTVCFAFTSLFVSYLNIFFEKDKEELISILTNLVFTIMLYYILIPRLGIVGAAVTTIFSYVYDYLTKLLIFYKIVKEHK
jgi:O-antigen/teichoic acid export membrane protein